MVTLMSRPFTKTMELLSRIALTAGNGFITLNSKQKGRWKNVFVRDKIYRQGW